MQEPRGVSLESGYSTDLSVPVPAENRNITGSVYGTRGMRELHVEYNQPRNRPRALQGERQCYRRHRSKEREECAAREPERPWFLLEFVRDSKVSGELEPLRFYLIFENDDC